MIQRLGILGGGQLGRLIAIEARKFGFHVDVLDPAAGSPCGQVADRQTVAAFDDLPEVLAFAARCDALTLEFENIPQATVAAIESAGHRIAPSSAVLRITQDRLLEKQFVRAQDIATAEFIGIDAATNFAAIVDDIRFPAILKTRRGGYDGKGQWRIATAEEAESIITSAFADAPIADPIFILEEVVPYDKEVSVVATRDSSGALVVYPLFENHHEGGILRRTVAPASVSEAASEKLVEIARRIGDALQFVGTFTVETFICGDDVIVNEIAPRVHNSGHLTLEAASASQFDNHVRAVTGLPLAPVRLRTPAAMVNILGQGTGDKLVHFEEILRFADTTLHLYGKAEAAANRKMGHITVLGATPEEARRRADVLAGLLDWE